MINDELDIFEKLSVIGGPTNWNEWYFDQLEP